MKRVLLYALLGKLAAFIRDALRAQYAGILIECAFDELF